MIVWLEKALVLAIHDRQIAEHAGSPGVRDDRLLDSALARPQQQYAYGNPPPDLADLAATLTLGLIRNAPFVDGNKRTAHVAYRTFLALNGAGFEGDDEEKYLALLALAEGRWSVEQFAVWLHPRLRIQSFGSAHEPRRAYRDDGTQEVTATLSRTALAVRIPYKVTG